jgi:hypothetical protein
MLGSITPLGERSRNGRWGITIGAFVLGSIAGGASVGTLSALAGLPLARTLGRPGSMGALAVALAVGLALDLHVGGLRLPTTRRQVNEDWLGRYRGWVYGVGFGFQLGTGLATIVSTSAVYLTFLAAGLSRSVMSGALIGAAFGASRAATAFAAAGVHVPEQLLRLDARVRRWDAPARSALLAAQLALLAVALAAVVT